MRRKLLTQIVALHAGEIIGDAPLATGARFGFETVDEIGIAEASGDLPGFSLVFILFEGVDEFYVARQSG